MYGDIICMSSVKEINNFLKQTTIQNKGSGTYIIAKTASAIFCRGIYFSPRQLRRQLPIADANFEGWLRSWSKTSYLKVTFFYPLKEKHDISAKLWVTITNSV